MNTKHNRSACPFTHFIKTIHCSTINSTIRIDRKRALNAFIEINTISWGGDDATLSLLFYPPSEKGLLLKERICSLLEQILSFYSSPFPEGIWCAGNQTGCRKSCLPCTTWRIYYQIPLIRQLEYA